MSITYTWKVSQVEAYPEVEGKSNVVFTVHWRLHGTEGEFEGSLYGSHTISLKKEGDFIPYEDLTEEIVISWVKEAMGEEDVGLYEANIASQIEKARNPTVINPPLPWIE